MSTLGCQGSNAPSIVTAQDTLPKQSKSEVTRCPQGYWDATPRPQEGRGLPFKDQSMGEMTNRPKLPGLARPKFRHTKKEKCTAATKKKKRVDQRKTL